MEKYSSCSVLYHVQFRGITEKISRFSIKALHKQWNNVLLLQFYIEKSYLPTST